MKATNTFSLLFAILIFSCYLERIEPEKSSVSSYSSSSANSSHPSSSSQIIAPQEPLLYQGQSYRTIKMGSIIWLGENLNATPKSGKWLCHGNLPTRCEQYGKLYDWAAAKSVCPDNWKLPSKEDFDNLSNFDKDILISKAWWNATLGGFKYEGDGDFSPELGKEGYWWSSTEAGNLANYSYIINGSELQYNYITKARFYSVRCIKK